MQGEELFTDEHLSMVYAKCLSWIGRIFRGSSYFIVALILIRMNTYGVPNSCYLALAIGLLGAGTASARIAQVSVGVLLFMAILPITLISTIHMAMN